MPLRKTDFTECMFFPSRGGSIEVYNRAAEIAQDQLTSQRGMSTTRTAYQRWDPITWKPFLGL